MNVFVSGWLTVHIGDFIKFGCGAGELGIAGDFGVSVVAVGGGFEINSIVLACKFRIASLHRIASLVGGLHRVASIAGVGCMTVAAIGSFAFAVAGAVFDIVVFAVVVVVVVVAAAVAVAVAVAFAVAVAVAVVVFVVAVAGVTSVVFMVVVDL